MLGWELKENQKPKQTQLFVELNDEEKVVFRLLKEKEKELLDVIALECKIPAYKAASILMNMELKGVVRPLPGKLFQLV
jgi:DNA processing protein